MIIRKLQNNDMHAWDTYVLNHPDGMPYQLTAWKNAIKKAYGFNPCYLIAEENEEDKIKIIGVLPLILHRIPFAKTELISLPFCDAGGPLTDSQEIGRALVEKAFTIAAKVKARKMSIRSASPFASINPDVTLNESKVRMLLTLPATSEELMASFKSKLRSQVKKPLKDGLTADIGSTDLLDDFYELFSENMRDLGSPVHSRKWFESILNEYGEQAHLVLIRLNDKTPVAGGIILCHPNRICVPWASSLRRFNRFNPNMLLYWTFLEQSIKMESPEFDFGRSTPGEGTYRFKKQWGAQKLPLHWAEYNHSAILNHDYSANVFQTKSSNGFARQIVESILKNTPLNISTVFGSHVRKYITL